MALIRSVGSLIARPIGLACYAGATYVSLSVDACGEWLSAVGASSAQCESAPEYWATTLVGIGACLFIFRMVILPFTWKEAMADIGSVSESDAKHGLSRAISIREFWQGLRREARILASIAVLIALAFALGAKGVAAGGGGWSPVGMILVASAVLFVATALLQPAVDFVPQVSRWLGRRTYESGR